MKGNGVDQQTLAICFGQFGPYHHARIAALQRVGREQAVRVVPVQIAGTTTTYAWKTSDHRTAGPQDDWTAGGQNSAFCTLHSSLAHGLQTLCEGVEEAVSPIEVFLQARRLFKRECVDVAFVPSYSPARYLTFTLAAKSLGIRTVMMNDSHAGTEKATGWKKWVKRQIVKRFDAALVAGDPQKRHFASLGIPADKIFTGYDAVDNDFFASRADEIRAAAKKSRQLAVSSSRSEKDVREAYGLPERYFLSLGRMVEKKNLAPLVSAYAKFCDENRSEAEIAEGNRVTSDESARQAPASLVFVGSGELEVALREQACGLGLMVIDRTDWKAGQSSHSRVFETAEGKLTRINTDKSERLASDRTGGDVSCRVTPALADSPRKKTDDRKLTPDDSAAQRGTVYFYGFRQIEENPVFYALAEAFVLPSLKEEWGLVVNEAMAAGLPVIVSRTAGCAEDLLPGSGQVAGGRHWYVPCRNRFLLGDNAVWQAGEAVKRLSGSPLSAEGNPRCLRTWLILMMAKCRGVPAAVWGHARGRGSRRMSIIRRALFSLASHIICYCYNEREYLTRLFPNKTIIVAGNSSVHRKDCAPLTESAESRNAVLFMGRLVASKKPMLLLQAVEILQKNGHDIGAVFIGEGPEKTFCERYAARAGLKGIQFAGEEFDVNKQRKLAQHCFALASPGYIGLSALDALGFGLPVAYCPTEPNSPEVETLVDGENALGFTRDSASALSSILYNFYENRVAWLARGAEHCRTISEKYSIEHMAKEFTKFFRETAELAGKQSVEASLEERSNGFVFDPKSIDALSEALRRIADYGTTGLKDDGTSRLAEMGARSREIVAKFSCENFARQALRAAEAASA